jgi:hypothetical protein
MKCTGTYRNNIEPYKVIPTLIFMHADGILMIGIFVGLFVGFITDLIITLAGV